MRRVPQAHDKERRLERERETTRKPLSVLATSNKSPQQEAEDEEAAEDLPPRRHLHTQFKRNAFVNAEHNEMMVEGQQGKPTSLI